VPYGTRAPKELATPSAGPGTAPTFCFRRPGRNAAGARGSRLLDRRPPHYRCPAVPGLKTPARAILTVPGSSVLPSEICQLPSGTAYYTAAFDSAALRQPAPSPVLLLLWLRTTLPDFPVRASAADAITGVLLTDFAAARQSISARPYCLSGLREELYPHSLSMSTPATTDFSMLERQVICPHFGEMSAGSKRSITG
jgi:hypothetical protein